MDIKFVDFRAAKLETILAFLKHSFFHKGLHEVKETDLKFGSFKLNKLVTIIVESQICDFDED